MIFVKKNFPVKEIWSYTNDMDRVDYATTKFVEIANIRIDNNEFVKNLIPSLIKSWKFNIKRY